MNTYRLPNGEHRTSHLEPHELPEEYANWVLLPEGLPGPPLDQIKVQAIEGIKDQHAAALAKLTGGERIEERDTWAPKAAAAQAYLKSSPELTDGQKKVIEGGAATRKIAPQNFAKLILEKSEEYHSLIARADDIRKQAEMAVQSATSAEEVAAAIEVAKARVAEAAAEWMAQAQ